MDILIGVVTESEEGINRGGEVLGRLLQAAISEPTDVQTIEMPQGGDEFNPPPGIRVLIVEAGPDCKMVVGVDDGIAPAMERGGRRIYSLDAEGMEVKAEVQLGPDGSVWIGNALGGATLSPTGTWSFHGVSSTFDHPVTVNGDVTVNGGITATGTVTAPSVHGTTDVTAGTISGKTHKHVTGLAGQYTSTPTP